MEVWGGLIYKEQKRERDWLKMKIKIKINKIKKRNVVSKDVCDWFVCVVRWRHQNALSAVPPFFSFTVQWCPFLSCVTLIFLVGSFLSKTITTQLLLFFFLLLGPTTNPFYSFHKNNNVLLIINKNCPYSPIHYVRWNVKSILFKVCFRCIVFILLFFLILKRVSRVLFNEFKYFLLID